MKAIEGAMQFHSAMTGQVGRVLGIVLIMSPLLWSATWAQNDAPAPAEETSAQSRRLLNVWRSSMKQVVVPKEGCFTANYPSTEWQEVPCVTSATAFGERTAAQCRW